MFLDDIMHFNVGGNIKRVVIKKKLFVVLTEYNQLGKLKNLLKLVALNFSHFFFFF